MVISVVFLTYCHEQYVWQALESIVQQKTTAKVEVILADDMSTDRTRDWICQFVMAGDYDLTRFQFVYAFTGRNLGAKANLYQACCRCTGKYIACLEGDDFWTDPYKLQKQMEYLEEHEDCSMVTHLVAQCDAKGEVMEPVCMRFFPPREKMTLSDVRYTIGHASSFFMRNFGEDMLAYYKYLRHEKYCPSDTAVPLFFYQRGYIYVFPTVMSTYRFVQKKCGTNWNSVHVYARDTLYFYTISKHFEKIASVQGIELNLFEERARFFIRAVNGFRKYHSLRQLFYAVAIFVGNKERFRLVRYMKYGNE